MLCNFFFGNFIACEQNSSVKYNKGKYTFTFTILHCNLIKPRCAERHICSEQTFNITKKDNLILNICNYRAVIQLFFSSNLKKFTSQATWIMFFMQEKNSSPAIYLNFMSYRNLFHLFLISMWSKYTRKQDAQLRATSLTWVMQANFSHVFTYKNSLISLLCPTLLMTLYETCFCISTRNF
jgi:hypothetical protein